MLPTSLNLLISSIQIVDVTSGYLFRGIQWQGHDIVWAVYFPSIISVLAGVCSGIAVGGFVATKTEQRIRGFQSSIDPMDKVSPSGSVKILIRTIIDIVLVGCLTLFIGLGILHMSGVGRLTGEAGSIFGCSWLVGMGIGKYIRYLYWKSRD